jgi:hypothetical protein
LFSIVNTANGNKFNRKQKNKGTQRESGEFCIDARRIGNGNAGSIRLCPDGHRRHRGRRREFQDAGHRSKLPAGTVESLLKPENKEKLKAILLYHVVSGDVTAAQVVKLASAKTVNGQDLKLTVNDGSVMVNEAKVVKADVLASNGVIHVIDTVLLPKD